MSRSDIVHRTPRQWIALHLDIASPLADIAASFLGSITGGGIQYHTDYEHNNHEMAISRLTAYIADDGRIEEKCAALTDFLDQLSNAHQDLPAPAFRSEPIIEQNWGQTWKKQFKPIQVTERLTIKPSWEEYTAKEDEHVLEIDPGMAFGTGLHASTCLSLQLIDSLFQNEAPPRSFLDVGTGTGILGMSAALLGCPEVLGIDNDVDAQVVAQENIAANNLQDIMRITATGLADLPGQFEAVVANIIHNTLVELAPQLESKVAPLGHLIVAGILSGEQVDNIVTIYSSLGFHLLKEVQREEWSALYFTKPA